MKEHLTLHRLRAILAILIALSLSLAPVASAWAAMPAKGVMSMASGDDGAMDCAKMGMAAEKSGTDFDCPCCDTKSKCPEMTTCLIKCNGQVLGMVIPAIKLAAIVGRHDRPTDPQEPPDWSSRPPAPPPRA